MAAVWTLGGDMQKSEPGWHTPSRKRMVASRVQGRFEGRKRRQCALNVGVIDDLDGSHSIVSL
eukprot:scaffold47414_cov29-Tisochrysis_lutea.AAC.11